MYELRPSDIERFWKYVDRKGPDDCWLWTGALRGDKKHGQLYGNLGVMTGPAGARKQKHVRAHAIAFFLANGYWPTGVVMHSCDIPTCVNPAHLSDSTVRENALDMMRKNRGDGQFQPGHKGFMTQARITQEIADVIRSEHVPHRIGGQRSSETSIKGLARKYGISKRTVQHIIQGKTWKP